MRIYNPILNDFVELYDEQGRKTLKNYIKAYQSGGSLTTINPTSSQINNDMSINDDNTSSMVNVLPKYGDCDGQNTYEQYQCAKNIVVVFLGGFHPFHRGHYLSYSQAKTAFGDNVCFYVAASNSWPKYKTGKKAPEYENIRPFPFEAKKQLAVLSGVNENEILCEMQPMFLTNLKQNIPNMDQKILIIVRSEKEIEDELIAGDEKAIIALKASILKLKTNKLTEDEIQEKGEKRLNKLKQSNPNNDPAYYRITGRGSNKNIEYDYFQPIPENCYKEDEDGNRVFEFSEESMRHLKPKHESQRGFIHITKTVGVGTENVNNNSLNLSSGTKIRKAYINALASNNTEMKEMIIKVLYPEANEEDHEYIMKIYDTYLNTDYLINYPKKPKKPKKSNNSPKKRKKSQKSSKNKNTRISKS